MDLDEIKQKAHYVAVTGIIHRNGKYLICKRSEKEKVFPGKWCVPGGKIEQDDFVNTIKDTKDHWFDIFEKTLIKEIKEEVNLEIKDIGFCSNLALIRPNGFSTIIVSLYADYDSGEVALSEDELSDFAWASLDELKNYELIENIYEQIVKVDGILRKSR